MSRQSFITRLCVRGHQVAVLIPFDPNQVWGEKARHDVSGTVNACPIRGPLQKDRDGYVLPLGPAWRREAGLDIRQPVAVAIAPESPQVEELAADLRNALLAAPDARAFFESIAPFYRKNYIRWIDEARRPETRAARIAQTTALLQEKKRQR